MNMEYKDFLGILMPYKKLMEDFNELYSMESDFMDGKYKLENNVNYPSFFRKKLI